MNSNSVIDLKKGIRKDISQKKKEFSQEWKDSASALILSKVEALPSFIQSGTVLLYYSLPDEVQTAPFLEKWFSVKRILIPLVVGDSLVLKVFSPGKIVPGYKSIPEPSADAVTVAPEEVGLAIVPGVAFDSDCRRLGRGKGFYDRLIPRLNCPLIGIGYDFQIVPRIPVESFDCPLNGVITQSHSFFI